MQAMGLVSQEGHWAGWEVTREVADHTWAALPSVATSPSPRSTGPCLPPAASLALVTVGLPTHGVTHSVVSPLWLYSFFY